MSGQPITRHSERRAMQVRDPEFARAYKRARREIDQVDALIRRLDELRAAAGLPKAELARLTGRNPSVIRRLFTTKASEERFDVFAHVAANLSAPLDDAETLARRMTSFLRLRNRIAHHEPVLFRAKHVFDRRTGEAKSGAALIDGLEGGLATFAADALKTIELARTIAPPAGTHLHGLEHAIQADINPLQERLANARAGIRKARDARRAGRREPSPSRGEGRSPPPARRDAISSATRNERR